VVKDKREYFFARTASSLLPKLKQKTKMRRVASLVSSLRNRKLHRSYHFSREWRGEERDVTVFFFQKMHSQRQQRLQLLFSLLLVAAAASALASKPPVPPGADSTCSRSKHVVLASFGEPDE